MCLKKLHKYTSKNYINIRLPQAGDAAPPPPANMRDWGGPAPGRWHRIGRRTGRCSGACLPPLGGGAEQACGTAGVPASSVSATAA